MRYRLVGTTEYGRGVLGAARTIGEATKFAEVLVDTALGNPARDVVIQRKVADDRHYSFTEVENPNYQTTVAVFPQEVAS